MTVPNAIADKGLLSTSAVAKELNVDRTTVWLWIRDRMLKAQRVGRYYAVHPDDLARFRKMYDVNPAPKKKRRRNKK